MKKRLRKKQRRGEFQELGFKLWFNTPESWSDEEHYTFLDEFFEKIDALQFAVGGGCGVEWDVFVTAWERRGTVTPEQRQELIDWLEAHPAVSRINAGPLVDAWYPPSGGI